MDADLHLQAAPLPEGRFERPEAPDPGVVQERVRTGLVADGGILGSRFAAEVRTAEFDPVDDRELGQGRGVVALKCLEDPSTAALRRGLEGVGKFQIRDPMVAEVYLPVVEDERVDGFAAVEAELGALAELLLQWAVAAGLDCSLGGLFQSGGEDVVEDRPVPSRAGVREEAPRAAGGWGEIVLVGVRARQGTGDAAALVFAHPESHRGYAHVPDGVRDAGSREVPGAVPPGGEDIVLGPARCVAVGARA
jgi:hypothetical protein